jgi:hypothetical protein
MLNRVKINRRLRDMLDAKGVKGLITALRCDPETGIFESRPTGKVDAWEQVLPVNGKLKGNLAAEIMLRSADVPTPTDTDRWKGGQKVPGNDYSMGNLTWVKIRPKAKGATPPTVVTINGKSFKTDGWREAYRRVSKECAETVGIHNMPASFFRKEGQHEVYGHTSLVDDGEKQAYVWINMPAARMERRIQLMAKLMGVEITYDSTAGWDTSKNPEITRGGGRKAKPAKTTTPENPVTPSPVPEVNADPGEEKIEEPPDTEYTEDPDSEEDEENVTGSEEEDDAPVSDSTFEPVED